MSMYQRVKRTVFEIIEPSANATGTRIASKIFDAVIMTLIVCSILSVFIFTFEQIRGTLFGRVLFDLEFLSLVIFTFEYALRLWTADVLYPNLGPLRSRLRYMRSAMALIDLISILPFVLLPFHFLPYNLVSIRMIRLVRLLRVFKLNRYSDALAGIGEVIKSRAHQMIASVFFVSIILILASLLIYYAEHDEQKEAFANAFSGLWWAVATLTTVGYGDIYPVTPVGRVIGAIIAILGIGMVAIPTSILSAGFMEMLEKRANKQKASAAHTGKTEDGEKTPSSTVAAPHEHAHADSGYEPPQYCPHCGKKLLP